jgi:hypothetical protein
LAEQLFCKQQVAGSIPVAGSMWCVEVRLKHPKRSSADAPLAFG